MNAAEAANLSNQAQAKNSYSVCAALERVKIMANAGNRIVTLERGSLTNAQAAYLRTLGYGVHFSGPTPTLSW